MRVGTAILDEVSPLQVVIVGIAGDRGPLQLNNATIALYDKQGAAPTDTDLINQTNGFCAVLGYLSGMALKP